MIVEDCIIQPVNEEQCEDCLPGSLGSACNIYPSQLGVKKGRFNIETHEFIVAMVGIGEDGSYAGHFGNRSVSRTIVLRALTESLSY